MTLMNKITIGILAHVDSGKTTLAEALLYHTGAIKRPGRVDHQNAYLDTEELEKSRGITIFSKQALLNLGPYEVTLVDTPGHIDFSAEMERTLSILDYAILLIDATSGINGHSKTLWRLLEKHKIPVFIFLNKTDLPTAERDQRFVEIRNIFGDRCIPMSGQRDDLKNEDIALCHDTLMEAYLQEGEMSIHQLREAVLNRNLMPCASGSAMKSQGVETFLTLLEKYMIKPEYPSDFRAKIFKISRDEQGQRLTHMKITGGNLKVKQSISYGEWDEKVNEIRIYSGIKYKSLALAEAGSLVAVKGLSHTRVGQVIGEGEWLPSELQSILTYQILGLKESEFQTIFPLLKQLEEELPEVLFRFDEKERQITLSVMGDIQLEILKSIIKERYDLDISFGDTLITYKETILNVVEGVGHFEPIGHYAEVQLLLEPMTRGSGLAIKCHCSDEHLPKNYQNLVMSHLAEIEHRGVLIGADITDMSITLVGGAFHQQHTQGGDFREATFRALRQGLKEAVCEILEPYYAFEIQVPNDLVGRVISDIERMQGCFQIAPLSETETQLTGIAPVINMRDYAQEILSFSQGLGNISLVFHGYESCHNPDQVLAEKAYDSEKDIEYPTGSLFCSKGKSYFVKWNEVKKHMHGELILKMKSTHSDLKEEGVDGPMDFSLGQDEIEQTIYALSHANRGKKNSKWKPSRNRIASDYSVQTFPTSKVRPCLPKILLVDGYNVIYGWEELKDIMNENMDSAKSKLLDLLSHYQAIIDSEIIVVFDAYRVKGKKETYETYENITVVYSGENQTADHFIEQYAYQNQSKKDITVVTSDAMEQAIARGAGSRCVSTRELKLLIEEEVNRMKETFLVNKERSGFTLGDLINLPSDKPET